MAFLCFLLSIALADSLRYPDAPCPAGSHRTVNHTGNWCTPANCSNDAQCLPPNWEEMPKRWKEMMADEQMICRPVPICVHTQQIKCGGGLLRKGEKDDCSFSKAETVSLCADGRMCSRGKCQNKSVCISKKDYKKITKQVDNVAAIAEQKKLNKNKKTDEESSCSTAAAHPSWLLIVLALVGWRRVHGAPHEV